MFFVIYNVGLLGRQGILDCVSGKSDEKPPLKKKIIKAVKRIASGGSNKGLPSQG
jgi:hypothetical protein